MIKRSKKVSLSGVRGHGLERGTAVEAEKIIEKNQGVEPFGRTHRTEEDSCEVGAGGDEDGGRR